jgi:CheY-like chemotaxis protein
MDGPEATKEIRALGYHAPIIGVTGNTLAMDLQRFEECGCNRVIGKPFSLELFQQYMAEFIREHRRTSVRIASVKKAPAEQSPSRRAPCQEA